MTLRLTVTLAATENVEQLLKLNEIEAGQRK